MNKIRRIVKLGYNNHEYLKDQMTIANKTCKIILSQMFTLLHKLL
jgi:hypothetical protein